MNIVKSHFQFLVKGWTKIKHIIEYGIDAAIEKLNKVIDELNNELIDIIIKVFA